MDQTIPGARDGLPGPGVPRRYRCGAIVRYSVGNGLELVYCRNTGSLHLMPKGVAALLGQCGRFRTLEQHAQKCSGGANASLEELTEMQSRLQQFADSGFLVSDNELFSELKVRSNRVSDFVPIASICIPTCNRLSTLGSCLESYISNCKQFGKSNDFVVVDDSRDPSMRKACRDLLATLRAKHDADIKYGGREEKVEFLRRLMVSKDLPRDVLSFALFGVEDHGLTSYGANQNAILLHAIGDTIFCADDDTVCRIGIPPAQAAGLSAVSGVYAFGENPWHTRLFPDRQTAVGSVNPVDTGVLDMHELYLGRDLKSCILAVGEDSPVDLDRTDFRFARMLRSGEGRVLVTVNGLVGDCASSSPADWLFLTGTSLEALIQSESEFSTLCLTRDCMRSVDRVIITDRLPGLYSTFLGLDNRELLPPFSPVARAQDLLFESLLSHCFYNVYYCRLPWTLLHEPVEPRAFAPQQLAQGRPGVRRVNVLISRLAGSLALGAWKADPHNRLRTVGRYLEELGRMPASEFEEMGRLLHWRSASVEIEHLEKAVEKAGPARVQFANTVSEYIRNLREGLAEREAWLPHDLREGRSSAEALELTQNITRRFGELLRWWPDIVDSARSLRAQGHALAKPV